MSQFVDYPREYFDSNIRVLKLGGLWSSDRKESLRKWLMFESYNYFCLILCEIIFYPSELSKVSYTHRNLKIFIEHMGMLVTHSMISFKTFTFFWQKKNILKLLGVLEDDELKYEPYGNFQPQQYFLNAKKLSTVITYGFLIAASSVPISNYIVAWYIYAAKYSSEDFGEHNMTCMKILPYYSWIPYSEHSKLLCGVALTYQLIPMVIYAWQLIAYDTLFIAVLIYAKAHILMLCGAFENIRERCMKTLKLPEDHDLLHDSDFQQLDLLMNKEINKCSKHLQIVLDICDTIEGIFTFGTLVQVFITLVATVSCLFMLSTEPIMGGTFAAESVYLVAIIYNLGMYSWFSNEVALAGLSIPDAIYSSEWLPASSRFRSSMVITIRRMQKPIRFTAGKFAALNLTTFVAILRGSYSYFAFLKNSNQA